jgi:hypothetical protein
MKREALSHPKLGSLAKRIGRTNGRVIARGALEGLWHLAGQHAPDGDLSRFTPEEIAEFIGWDENPDELLDILVETRWLDRVGERLVVHDWSDHADGSVHKKLARARRLFADGRPPILSHLGGPTSFERKAAAEFYASTESPRSFHGTPVEFRGTEPEPRLSPARAEKNMGGKETPPVSSPATSAAEQHVSAGSDSTFAGHNVDGARLPKTPSAFDVEFETAIRPIYPKREGDQRWKQALAYFRAARKSGEPLETMVAGVKRYAARCERKGLTGTDKVKQAATFFGREKCWLDLWAASAASARRSACP